MGQMGWLMIDSLHSNRALAVLSGLAVVAALYLARDFLIPVALAAFLCFALSPLVSWLEGLRIRRVLASLIVIAAFMGSLGWLGWVVVVQGNRVAADFEQYRTNVQRKVAMLEESGRATMHRLRSLISREPWGSVDLAGSAPLAEATTPALGSAADAASQPISVQIVPTTSSSLFLVWSYLGTVFHPLATAAIALVLLTFFLIFRDDLRDRLVRLCGQAQIAVTTTALDDSGRRLERFIAAQLLSNCVIGTAIGLGLFFMGIPSALLWGVLAAVLRFVPYIGAFIAAAFPVGLSLAVSDNWLLPAMVLGWIIAVDSLSAHLLEPLLFGSTTGTSPPALLVSYLFWTWLWGGAGLLLATPLTVCLIVLGKHVPAFEMFYVLLGSEPVFESRTRLYQRLLAGDRGGVKRIVEAHNKSATALETLDEVVLPALAEIERDRAGGLLDIKRLDQIRGIVSELLDDLVPVAPESAAPPPTEGKALAAIILDRGEFDSVSASLLERLAAAKGLWVQVFRRDQLAGEIAESLRGASVRAIVMAGIQPPDFNRFTLILRRIGGIVAPRYLLLYVAPSQTRAMERGLAALRGAGRRVSLVELVAALDLLPPATPEISKSLASTDATPAAIPV